MGTEDQQQTQNTVPKSNLRLQFERFGFDTNNWSGRRVFLTAVIHEACGAGLLIGMWAFCYKVRLTQRLVQHSPKYIQQYYSKGLTWSHNKLSRYSVLKKFGEPNRLLISGAESFVVRKVISPVTIPAKLVVAFSLAAIITK